MWNRATQKTFLKARFVIFRCQKICKKSTWKWQKKLPWTFKKVYWVALFYTTDDQFFEKVFWKSNSTQYNEDMPKLIIDYFKRSCSAPLSTEEPSSLSIVETSSSSQRTETDVQTSRTIHINDENLQTKTTKAFQYNVSLVLIILFQWNSLGKKTQLSSLLFQELFLASLFQRKGLSFLHILHKA